MKCRACGRDLKTYEDRQHLAKEAADYRQRRGFWDDYNNAGAEGYTRGPEDYAWGRAAGLLDLLGKERGSKVEEIIVDDDAERDEKA